MTVLYDDSLTLQLSLPAHVVSILNVFALYFFAHNMNYMTKAVL